ncbi:hypothetical protein [Leifsonia shinshuensis]|uniref:hypothetical protein n=1 Tax=Leifsonia shinshuensis TaxID=150026 RepID=UPI002867525D|nr:hypothetical protein [Leifsonia shinshuensis]MDR6972716.1 hypothetical protein [Leifsonia shinshuensis]
MHQIVAFLISGDPDGEPESLILPPSADLAVPPVTIRRPIRAPDGDLVEVWERCSWCEPSTATYLLTHIEDRSSRAE